MGFKFELGDKVEDEMSGFTGTITVRSEHLTGCDRYCVRPEPEEGENEYPDAEWFDEQRLSQVESDKGWLEKIKDRTKSGKPGASGTQDEGKPSPS